MPIFAIPSLNRSKSHRFQSIRAYSVSVPQEGITPDRGEDEPEQGLVEKRSTSGL